MTNIRDKENIQFGLDMIEAETRSSYTTTQGQATDWYWDMDRHILGSNERNFFDANVGVKRIDQMVERLCHYIEKIRLTHHVNRLAFLDSPTGGPIGIVALASSILSRSSMPGCFVRPKRDLLAAAYKGPSLASGERTLLLSDVATSGKSLLLGAKTLRKLGADVSACLVALDRDEEAAEVLGGENIELISMWNSSDRLELQRMLDAA